MPRIDGLHRVLLGLSCGVGLTAPSLVGAFTPTPLQTELRELSERPVVMTELYPGALEICLDPVAEIDVIQPLTISGAMAGAPAPRVVRESVRVFLESAAPEVSPEPVRALAEAARTRCQSDDPRVEQLSESRWSLDRELVQHYARHPGEAQQLAWLTWAHRGDDVMGFELRQLGCSSVLYSAGLRSGDVITAVNGHPVTSLSSAMSLSFRLRKADRFVLDVLRDGRSRRLHYALD